MNSFKTITLGILILALAACTGNLNNDNYTKITTGMAYEEVIEILGNPTDEVTSEVTSQAVDMGKYGKIPSIKSSVHTWSSGTDFNKRIVTISFQDDRVVSKAKAGF